MKAAKREKMRLLERRGEASNAPSRRSKVVHSILDLMYARAPYTVLQRALIQRADLIESPFLVFQK